MVIGQAPRVPTESFNKEWLCTKNLNDILSWTRNKLVGKKFAGLSFAKFIADNLGGGHLGLAPSYSFSYHWSVLSHSNLLLVCNLGFYHLFIDTEIRWQRRNRAR